MAALEVRGLKVVFETDDGIVEAVRGIDFDVNPGERLGFVGESGSGKTTTALALMGMIDAPGRVAGGTARLAGVDLLRLSPAEHAARRLVDVAYIPQGAMNSLNPVMRVGAQIADGMIDHGAGLGRAARKARVAELLRQVGLEPSVAERFPHELSGGMKQRVAIAISIALKPQLLIADEPTSALDVITQRRVMQTLREVQDAIGAGLILIGHDMGLMAQFVDRIMVLRHGRLVEEGEVRQIFRAPRDGYTKELIESVPALERRQAGKVAEPKDATAAPIIELDGAAKTYRRGLFDRTGVPALQPLSFSMAGGTPLVVSIVGQSGSGKSTLGSLLLGFLAPSEGRVLFEGRDLQTLSAAERRESHRRVQAVFQDPYAAYNPFYKVDHNLAEPLRNFGLARDRASVLAKMREACELVGLDPDQTIHRFAHQLSGGQRQRLMVGRAMMLGPRLLVADEPVSMVDASLRSSILGTLRRRKDEQGISILYITHDLATAYEVSDYVLVLYRGRVVEAGDAETVIKDPKHPYTRLLVGSIPWPDPDRHWGGDEKAEAELAERDRQGGREPCLVRSTIPGFSLAA